MEAAFGSGVAAAAAVVIFLVPSVDATGGGIVAVPHHQTGGGIGCVAVDNALVDVSAVSGVGDAHVNGGLDMVARCLDGCRTGERRQEEDDGGDGGRELHLDVEEICTTLQRRQKR